MPTALQLPAELLVAAAHDHRMEVPRGQDRVDGPHDIADAPGTRHHQHGPVGVHQTELGAGLLAIGRG